MKLSWVFEKLYKISKPLARLRKRRLIKSEMIEETL